MSKSLDFIRQMSKHSSITEKYGEKVADKIFFSAHMDENVLGVFWYHVPGRDLIYSSEIKNHASFPDYQEIVALPGTLYRGRVVKYNGLIVVMIYTVGDVESDPTQEVLADIVRKIVGRSGLAVDYVVDDDGKSLIQPRRNPPPLGGGNSLEKVLDE